MKWKGYIVCHGYVLGGGDRCMKATTFIENGVRTTFYCWRLESEHWDYPRGELFQ